MKAINTKQDPTASKPYVTKITFTTTDRIGKNTRTHTLSSVMSISYTVSDEGSPRCLEGDCTAYLIFVNITNSKHK